MPPYDSILRIARLRTDWWVRIHQAVRCMSDEHVEPFPDFVRDHYTSDRPAQLGKIAIAYAFTCREDASHLYALVNRLVVSDMAHMTTVEGLECLILLATLYSDEGQPRRGWMVFRRGVVVAQLTVRPSHILNAFLHTTDTTVKDLAQASLHSTTKKRLWMAIYRGDRMMSLFLGLPYGFNDIHHQDLLDLKPDDNYWDAPLTIGVAKLSGRTIDRNLSKNKHCFSRTLQLDEEMDELAATYPKSWWDRPDQLVSTGRYSDEVWTRLHLQMFFFHLRLYIYLPFFSTAQRSVHSSTAQYAGMQAARELLRRYLTLHDRPEQGSLSECKLVDFMAFTAAVILLLGCSQKAAAESSDVKDDIETVLSLTRLLKMQEDREKCRIASQCRKTLEALLESNNDDKDVHIPFFGIVSRKGILQREEIPAEDSMDDTSFPEGVEDNSPNSIGNSSLPVADPVAGYLTPHNSVQSGRVVPELPSDAYNHREASTWMAGFGSMPELDFLYQPETSPDFGTDWDFFMDVDTF